MDLKTLKIGVDILTKYASHLTLVDAQHDEISIYNELKKVSDEDKEILEENGWFENEEEGWTHYC